MSSNSIYTLVLSALAVVGLIVLIAMGKITWGDGGPLIAAIIGVHGGASVAVAAGATTTPPPAPPAPVPPVAVAPPAPPAPPAA